MLPKSNTSFHTMLFTLLYLHLGLCDVIPLVNGYVRLSFNPPNLVASRGTCVSGYVNISIDEDVQPQDSLLIHSCCLDQHVAKLKQVTSSPLKNNSMLSLEIIGKKLGKSAVKFYIAAKDSPPPNFSKPNSSRWWWVAYSYDVIVQDDEHTRIIGFYLIWVPWSWACMPSIWWAPAARWTAMKWLCCWRNPWRSVCGFSVGSESCQRYVQTTL